MKNKTDLPKAGAIAIAGIWVMAAAVSVLSASHGSGYDVLDKIADSTSVGVSLEEKISGRIDASTSDMTYYLKRLDTLMCDYRAEKVTDTARPEYDPLKYVDVSKCDISKIKLSDENQVTDEKVMDFIYEVLKKEKKYTEKDMAEDGDLVNLDYTMTEKGNLKPFVSVTDETRTVGHNTFPDKIDALLDGAKAGDEIETEYEFPDDYGDEAYAGKVFEYNIKINGVYDIELTDEVVSSLSNGADTVSEYKKFIKNYLEYLSLNDIGENEVEELCNEAVVKSYPEDVLTYDVQQEFVKIMNLAGVNSMEDDAFEDYVKKQGYDSLEDYIKTTTENTKKNLEEEMKILAIAKENNLWLDNKELGKEILNQATGYTGANDYYTDYSKYHAQYVVAKFNIAKEIQKSQ
jgi:FKBP-type peptidyl-prolyl cis-trans isomerase (trigger factor)